MPRSVATSAAGFPNSVSSTAWDLNSSEYRLLDFIFLNITGVSLVVQHPTGPQRDVAPVEEGNLRCRHVHVPHRPSVDARIRRTCYSHGHPHDQKGPVHDKGLHHRQLVIHPSDRFDGTGGTLEGAPSWRGSLLERLSLVKLARKNCRLRRWAPAHS